MLKNVLRAGQQYSSFYDMTNTTIFILEYSYHNGG